MNPAQSLINKSCAHKRKKIRENLLKIELLKIWREKIAEMDNNYGYQNTEKMEVDDTPLFPVERPDGYYEGGFSMIRHH